MRFARIASRCLAMSCVLVLPFLGFAQAAETSGICASRAARYWPLSRYCASPEVRAVCFARDNGRVDCVSLIELQQFLNAAQQDQLRRALTRIHEALRLNIEDEVLVGCSNGDINGLNLSLTQPADPFSARFSTRDLRTAKARCHASSLLDIGVRPGDISKKGIGGQYLGWVGAMTTRIDNARKACQATGAGATIAKGMGSPLPDGWDLLILLTKTPHSDEEAKRREAQAAKDREDLERLRAEEERRNDEVYLEFLRREAEKEAAERKREEEEARKKKAAEKQATEKKHGGRQMGDFPVTKPCPDCEVASCVDEACAPTCREMQEAWFDFKNQCTQTNWQAYGCASFLRAMNNCVDTALIYPTPDGDHTCAKRADAATLEAARKAHCKKVGGLMTPAPDGTLKCASPFTQRFESRPPGDICNDPRALVAPEQCTKPPATATRKTPPVPKPTATIPSATIAPTARMEALRDFLDSARAPNR